MRLTITHDRVTVFDKTFEEAKHPRGHEGNPGQFAAGGSSGTTAEPPDPGPKSVTTSKHQLHPADADRDRWPEHVKALKIPPAWRDLKISHDPNATMLASGVDAAGRKQAIYSKKFQDSQSALKFSRIHDLMSKYDEVSTQNAENRKSTNQTTRDHADCAALVMDMGVRPGSDDDTKAKVKAYGATTLEGRHVAIENGVVRLKFTGKKGVNLDLPVHNEDVAKMLIARAKAAGPDGKLFGDKVSGGSLLTYVHGFDGGGFKTKDFRTLLATKTANDLVSSMEAPSSTTTYKKSVMTVAKAVSQKLGNTPTVALQSYINPFAFESWREHAPTS